MPHDVFISYSSKDRAAADAICQTLEATGIQCWIAPRDITPGQNYAAAIIEGISSAKVFVLVFSSHANASNQVERELERAVSKKIPVVPVRVQNVQPAAEFEYWISTAHWLDAFAAPFEQHLPQVTASVLRTLGRTANPAAINPPRPRQESVINQAGAASETTSGRWSQRLAIVSAAATLVLALAIAAISLNAKRPAANTPSLPTTTNPSAQEQQADLEEQQLKQVLANASQAINLWDRSRVDEMDLGHLASLISQYREWCEKLAAARQLPSAARLPSALEKLAALQRDFDSALDSLDRRQQEVKLAAESADLEGTVGDPASFAARLTQLARAYPAAPQAKDFSSVAEESSLWSAIVAWSELMSNAAFTDPSLTPSAATELLAEGDTLDRDFPIAPFDAEYEKHRDYISPIAQRVDLAGKPLYAGLRDYLSQHLLDDLFVVQLKSGTYYYLDTDPSQLVPRNNGQLVLNFIENARRETNRDEIDAQDIRFRGRAPHCDLANTLRTILDAQPRINSDNWNDTFCRMLERIVDDQNADPVPRALMFGETLRVAALGSAEIEQAFRAQAKSYVDQKFDPTIAWFNPADPRATNERNKAREFFHTMLPVAVAAQDAASLVNQFRKRGNIQFTWIGYLRFDSDQGWRLASQQGTGNSRQLYVVDQTPAKQIALQEIGSISAGTIHWTDRKNLLRAGRPVFIRIQP